jgi:hypothetical protein
MTNQDADADARIAELERQLATYRKQYNALWDAARRVVESAARELNYSDDVLLVSTVVLRELSRCVSSISVAHEPAPLEDTQTPEQAGAWEEERRLQKMAGLR